MVKKIAGAAATLAVLGMTVVLVRAGGLPTPRSTSGSPSPVPPRVQCVARAVDKREAAIRAAVKPHADKVMAAYETRGQSLNAAWQIANRPERNEKIRLAWKAWREKIFAARQELKRALDEIWKTFTIERKGCGELPTGENPAADTAAHPVVIPVE